MKILFIGAGKSPDYMCDTIFHGLKTVYGNNVYENTDHWYLFDDTSSKEYVSRSKYFTLYGNLPSKLKNVISAKEIKKSIKAKEFDFVVYGSIWRCTDYFSIVSKNYPKEKIIFIDGEDHTQIHKFFFRRGVYFKRELDHKIADVFPICFGIPESKIIDRITDKSGIMAHIIPGELSTYIYETEEDYYKGYRSVCFGITKKKAGWDCLRHYEILANGCIPYFINLKGCPSETMHLFPKELILKTNNMIENKIIDIEEIKRYSEELLIYTRNYLTTKRIMQYMLEIIRSVKQIGKPCFSIYPGINYLKIQHYITLPKRIVKKIMGIK
jgi:hypothetical protein